MSMDNLKIAIEESVKEAFGDNAKYILRNWEFRQESDFIIWAEENPSYTKYPSPTINALSKLWRKPDGCMSIS